jgi:hypothetical protein
MTDVINGKNRKQDASSKWFYPSLLNALASVLVVYTAKIRFFSMNSGLAIYSDQPLIGY